MFIPTYVRTYVRTHIRRAIVTHKRALIKSELPVLKTIEDAIPGRTTHGIIAGVVDYGVFVTLYGNLKGLAGSQDLGLAEGQSIADAYAVGQVIRTTIVSADRGENKLRLSLGGGGGNARAGVVRANVDDERVWRGGRVSSANDV